MTTTQTFIYLKISKNKLYESFQDIPKVSQQTEYRCELQKQLYEIAKGLGYEYKSANKRKSGTWEREEVLVPHELVPGSWRECARCKMIVERRSNDATFKSSLPAKSVVRSEFCCQGEGCDGKALCKLCYAAMAEHK